MNQSSIDPVWATITQHIRATGLVSKIAVLDGNELLRMWQLSPDGTRTQLEIVPTTTPDEAEFRLLLSPWLMSVPYEDGPDVREVSTLSVARAQATDAATAGNVNLILQTTGTDEDTSELIEPSVPETVTAPQALDDEPEDDLFEELADGDTGPSEAQRKFRRRAILGGSALGLFLLGSVSAAGWALFNAPGTSPESTPEAAATSSAPSATPEPSESATALVSQALPPAGFSGTPSWEVVGATDQSSGMTWNGAHVGAVSGRALDVVETDSGEIAESVTLPTPPTTGPAPLRDGDDGGMLLATDDRVMTWSQEHGLVDSEIGEDDRLVLRGTTAFTVPQNDDVRPDALQLVTTDGFHEIVSPDSSAAPIGPTRNGGFLWATNDEGGTLLLANEDGEEESSTRLIGPSENTTISQWLGASEDYAAAIWANDGSGSVIAVHDAETGKIVDTYEMGTTGAGAGMRIVPSTDGQQLVAGSTLIDLDTGKIEGSVSAGSSTTQTVETVPGGWTSTASDGTQTLIGPDGESLESPETTESLLGLTESGEIVVDHRGAIAAFTPATEGESQ
ncbi:hypothetical protein EDL96_11525 [Kocuria soli]|uniref:Uncharacterized protein n=1 Tax=Kocuria soli TaxID=2485125 RepID=A0A3N3ZUZ0_9MICC|nr:hypothetical protein [Kocuria soli]ROZ62083.1 hypothetical protein EDL96_11525 [Kocuria soli]